MNQNYSASVPDSKPNRLAQLQQLAEQQIGALKTSYNADGRTGVVKTTTSKLTSATTGGGSTVTGQSDMGSISDTVALPQTLGALPAGGAPEPNVGFPNNANSPYRTYEEKSTGQTITNTGTIEQTQTITNTDYGYRFPYVEAEAQYQRAQISLMDEQFAQFMSSLNLPNLIQVFQNELSNIDYDVYRLQIAYTNTILMSPINGTVTVFTKIPVTRSGRVNRSFASESNDVILCGDADLSGAIAIGSSVTVASATAPAM